MPGTTIEELKDAANLVRGCDLVARNAAGSGHAGGTLSITHITAALYLRVAEHDPGHCLWRDRDRVIWTAGHKAPVCISGWRLAASAFLRKLRSPYQGHPHWLTLPGVEVSTGSLGQGLSIAVGIAPAGKLSGKSYTTFCIMGDFEQQEGQIGKPPWKPAIINWTTWWESSIATGCRSMAQLLT